MMLHWHIDCASGAAGDMLLAAMLDLGAPRSAVDEALMALGLRAEYLTVQRCVRGGIAAADVRVRTELGVPEWLRKGHEHEHGHGHEHEHDHDHGHAARRDASPVGHAHYHYGCIRDRIIGAPLRPEVRELAIAIFDRLARAEAQLHGSTVDAVQFHEVGAIDSIVDVVGCAAAFCALAPTSVSCSPVAMGAGTLRCAHGVLPVPAPAALAIMTEANALIYGGGIARELCTPTGAAVLATIVTAWGEMPMGQAAAVGWGAGDNELADRPNVVRITSMQRASGTGEDLDMIWQLEANIDDLNPQLCDAASAAMFTAGALDVWWSPITMKKGRLALLCGALAPRHARDAVADALMRETTSIGVRYFAVARSVMQRRMETVATPYGAVRIKVSSLAGRDVTATPEFDDCAACAKAAHVAVRDVITAAQLAWHGRQHA